MVQETNRNPDYKEDINKTDTVTVNELSKNANNKDAELQKSTQHSNARSNDESGIDQHN